MQGHQALDNSSKNKFAEEWKYGETTSEMQAHRKKTETKVGMRREGKRKEKGKTERRKVWRETTVIDLQNKLLY